jgi:nitrate reductase alpha subunit
MIQTAYWYLHTDQFRYGPFSADTLAAASAAGAFAGQTTADLIVASARMGWMPSYPTFNRNPLDLADDAEADSQTAAGGTSSTSSRPGGCASPVRTRTLRRTSRA